MIDSPRLRAAAVLLAVLAAILPSAVPAEPVTVVNDRPAGPPATIRLQEQWRVGGEGDDEFLFGMMIDSMTDEDGNVYLLDNQLCHVEVFARDGSHVATLSRQGEGPGEVQVPQNLVWMPDGKLGIVELFPGRIVTLDRDGTPGPTVTFGGGDPDGPQTGFVAAIAAKSNGGTLAVVAQRAIPSDEGQTRTQFLARIDAGGRELARYREDTVTLNLQTPKLVESEFLPPYYLANAVGPDGRVYAPRSRGEYAIEVYAPDGTLERVIERSFEPVRRDERANNRMNALIDAWAAGFPGRIDRVLDENEPAIADLFVTDDGTLWVLHARSGLDQPDGVLFSFDTFDPEGRWLREVRIAADGDPAYDGLIPLGDGRMLLVRGYQLARWASRGAQNASFGEEDESGPMEVVCCRMVE